MLASGPPPFRLNSPRAVSAMTRPASASIRKRGPCQRSRLSGSINFGFWILDFGLSAETSWPKFKIGNPKSRILDDCWYVAEDTINRCSHLRLQPCSTNSTASQSSSSACDGASPFNPKSSLVLTSPVPKYVCQTRLTIDRAAVSPRSSTSQRAKSSRVGLSVVSSCKNDGVAG